ncbi:hypothetical protein HD554DRAFT_1699544 [Boletus coccyginus]|nr:hypothetical protein HD554DRAFT_1699544 [Boletus coccyginus]
MVLLHTMSIAPTPMLSLPLAVTWINASSDPHLIPRSGVRPPLFPASSRCHHSGVMARTGRISPYPQIQSSQIFRCRSPISVSPGNPPILCRYAQGHFCCVIVYL